jgi:phosphate transport system permease protein
VAPRTARPPLPASPRHGRLREAASGADRVFGGVGAAAAAVLGVAVLLFLVSVIGLAAPSLRRFGWGFVVGANWDPVHGEHGALPFLFGTVVTSSIALGLAVPLGLGVAVFLTDLGAPGLRRPVSACVQLLAAIPSVVYGLWGALVLAPFLRDRLQPLAEAHLGPLFHGPRLGVGLLCASLVLALMVVPTIAAVSREVLRAVPADLREAALALGATPWDVVRRVVLPHARFGLFGAVLLGFGRAAGETMAVAMVIGSRAEIGTSLFSPGQTMASVIANEFTDATSELHVAALAEIGLLLFVFTLLVNVTARVLVARGGRRLSPGGPRLVREGGS